MMKFRIGDSQKRGIVIIAGNVLKSVEHRKQADMGDSGNSGDKDKAEFFFARFYRGKKIPQSCNNFGLFGIIAKMVGYGAVIFVNKEHNAFIFRCGGKF